MKTITKFLSITLGFVLICFCFWGCGSGNENAQVEAEEYSYVSMRINPEIELVIDKDGIVVAVNAINEDGETVLCNLELIGLTAEEAGAQFTAMAIELGFIDVDTEEATVYIVADGKNKEFSEEIEQKLEEKINECFDKKGVFGKAEKEDLSAFEEMAERLGVSVKDAMLISRILNLYPEMTEEQILALSIEERIELVKEDKNKNGMPADLRDEYKQAIEQLKEEYAQLFELEKQLFDLKKQLKNKELTEEEIASIEEQIASVKEQYDALKEQYMQAVEQIKQQKHEKVEEVREGIKRRSEQRRAEFEDKVKQHEEEVEENREECEKRVRDWRNKR